MSLSERARISLGNKVLFLFQCYLAMVFTQPWLEARGESKPNIVFILADDLGWAVCVSSADARLGMAELDRLGLRDDRIMVLWGDHGDWCQITNVEWDTRVPFFVSAPGFEVDSQ